MIVKRRGKKGG
jgi:small subunit ribosomal protein S19